MDDTSEDWNKKKKKWVKISFTFLQLINFCLMNELKKEIENFMKKKKIDSKLKGIFKFRKKSGFDL